MLRGKSFTLRPIREADLSAVYDAYSQVDDRGEFYPHVISPESTFRKRYYDGEYWQDDYGRLLILDAEDQIFGQIEFFRPAPYLDCYEIAYLIYSPAHRGKGAVTESVRLLGKYLFETKKVNRLQLLISTENTASRRVAEKCGYTHEGTMRGAWFNMGRSHDMEVYSLLRAEWASQQAG